MGYLELKLVWLCKTIAGYLLYVITNITLLGKQSIRSKSSVSMSKYRQQLKYKYKSLFLSSPEEVLECRSSEYVNLFLTKFDEKSKTKNENLVSGYLNRILKNQSKLPWDMYNEDTMTGDKSLTFANILDVREKNKSNSY